MWSWDITTLRGPTKGVFYQLYVVMDIFSRYVVTWLLAPNESGESGESGEPGESGESGEEMIAEAVARHQVPEGQLSIHADRGTSTTSKPVSDLLIRLGVERSHSRPHVSNDSQCRRAEVYSTPTLVLRPELELALAG